LRLLLAALSAGWAAALEGSPDTKPIVTAEQEFEVPDAAAAGGSDGAADRALTPGDASGSLIEEWDRTMDGFVPELLLTFPLAARSDEFFFEDVPEGGPPPLIRGGFFAAASEETSSVEFSITDPKGKVVYKKEDAAEGLFQLLAETPGTYTFCVSNHKWMQEKMVTFAVGKGKEPHLQSEHLTTMEDHVKSIERTLMDIQTESTYLWIRQKSHMKAVESIHNRVLAFCVVEFLILIGLSGFQVYYIKGLLSDRRIL